MKWEYRKTKIESIEQMNEYGQEEWELVAVSGYIAFYKRPADMSVMERQTVAADNLRRGIRAVTI